MISIVPRPPTKKKKGAGQDGSLIASPVANVGSPRRDEAPGWGLRAAVDRDTLTA